MLVEPAPLLIRELAHEWCVGTMGPFIEMDPLLRATGADLHRIDRSGGLREVVGPPEFTAPEITLHLSVGARYRLRRPPPDGELFHVAGQFLEIHPRRPAYTFGWEAPDPGDRQQSSGCASARHSADTDLPVSGSWEAYESVRTSAALGVTSAAIMLRTSARQH